MMVAMMFKNDINIKGSAGSSEDSEAITLITKTLKLDVTQFPEFKGTIEGWLYFKRKCLAMAKTHGIKITFQATEAKFTAGSQAESIYFAFSVLTQRIHG